jgi:SAM-dependent methyltransferase/uncharacterized protein YbaR (Trm112 family)
MREKDLEILRCSFCGSTLSLERDHSLEIAEGEVANGIIICQCSAYPVVAGIPCFTADHQADAAREHLSKGDRRMAFFAMLGIEEEDRRTALRNFIERGNRASYREGLAILCPDAEGDYFIHRFSDPTFLIGETLLGAVAGDRRCFAKRAIDICGGSGHLTRSICRMSHGGEVCLADAWFWKLWLAKRFIAPECLPVCCDANNPLPFVRDAFSLAVCSDAFHYIWSKRLFADEMIRIAGDSGIIVLSHIHNALVENHSAGMPLEPRWWRNLFAELNPRLFKETGLFESALAGGGIDLSRNYSDLELQDEAALVLIATKLDGFHRTWQSPLAPVSGTLRVNPLFKVETAGDTAILDLQFPSPDYEQEFSACKRYLPDRVELDAALLGTLPAAAIDPELRWLIENRVLLDLPDRYL